MTEGGEFDEEGEEVIDESREREDAAADLALIAAAQKVEHYDDRKSVRSNRVTHVAGRNNPLPM